MDNSSQNTKKNTILVVDDQPQNIRLIGTLLREHYNLLIADNGPKAIETARGKTPDLILLDIMMPDMSGFEVCEILKSDEQTREIPIIFLTAKTETEDILKAFEIGGVDYVTKPFNALEVMARIKTHLDLKNSKDLIKEQNAELLQKNEQITKAYKDLETQSQHLNKLYLQLIQNETFLRNSNEELKKLNEMKDKFFSIVSHDLKSPFAGILTMTDIINHHLDEFSKDELADMLRSLNNSAQQTYKFLEDLLEWSRSQMGRLQMNITNEDLASIIGGTLLTLNQQAELKNITIENNVPVSTYALFDNNMMATIVRNLVSNAIKFTHKGGKVTLNAEKVSIDGKPFVRLSVSDTGVGMDEAKILQLFSLEKVQSTPGTEKEKGTGLGIVICRDFIEKMGGKIAVESKLNEGTTFFVDIPAED
ncbi:MAG: hybrid sensor histidine kinase/response regulator [Ignavibacteria bacterium]|nr:hybrid sensor histidine kinase/response regulator [Ignavibacteria bacterium]